MRWPKVALRMVFESNQRWASTWPSVNATALRDWIGKQAEAFLGGGRGRATWERAEKNWLDQQFKLPDPDPLAPPAPTPTPTP